MLFRLLTILLVVAMTAGLHAQSVLQQGDWYKVGVTKDGVYKLDRSFLADLGLPVESLDPQTLQVYGSGGDGMLPQSNDVARPTDLSELAIMGVGDQDGSLDNGDYYLFYAQSPDKTQWTQHGFLYEKHLYADTTYYFITWGQAPGKRLAQASSLAAEPTVQQTYNDAIIHEEDVINIISSGRNWYDETLSNASGTTQSHSFNIPNVQTYDSLIFSAIGRSETESSMRISLNGSTVGTLDFGTIPTATYTVKATSATETFNLTGSGDDLTVDIQFNPGEGSSIGHADYFIIGLTRNLVLTNEALIFRSLESLESATTTYAIENANGSTEVWDVTDPLNPARRELTIEGTQGTFTTSSENLKEFVAFTGADLPQPVPFGSVPNQSISSITNVDGIIITHPEFLTEAQRLADFHQANDGLMVQVVTTRQVYNEFSSGMQDVTALRDFVRHLYNVSSGQLKYLLLFGDASYDYKDRLSGNTNFVPIYESRNSFHPIFSYSSDDYFAFLEDDEGYWEESAAGDHTMDIGVGRLPAKDRNEARQMVDKIIRYASDTKTLGPWRNTVAYITDDGDANVHVNDAENLIDFLDENGPFNIKKLYLDAFEQIENPSSERSPEMTRAITQNIDRGLFLINYMGHGNERLWMDEQVVTTDEINDFKNFQQLPIFITATCEFGRYDDPFQFSGAERLMTNEQGAIGLLTTTRPVFASTNLLLNEAFHESILGIGLKENFRLGDIIRSTKNNSLTGPVNRNFALLGDPMLRPAYPKYEVGIPELEEEQTFSALQQVNLTGQVTNDGVLLTDFNGLAEITLYDTPIEKTTKGQESSPVDYTEQDNILFRGQASVANGEFDIAFVLPKNISYKNQPGKFSIYAWESDGLRDAAGEITNVVIGGTAQIQDADTEPPELEAYINEPGFKNGATVGPGALLIANFTDENGINTSYLGFDRGITLDLNGEIIELNDFYVGAVDDFTRGTVFYPLDNLEPGRYTAKIKGSDTYNNSVEKTVEFVVSNQPILQIFDFLAYPNPARNYTNFAFSHDREGETLNIQVTLYSTQGEIILQKNHQEKFSTRSVDLQLDWSSRGIRDGMYLYKLNIESEVDGTLQEKTGRLYIQN